jgi:hypothetical protein
LKLSVLSPTAKRQTRNGLAGHPRKPVIRFLLSKQDDEQEATEETEPERIRRLSVPSVSSCQKIPLTPSQRLTAAKKHKNHKQGQLAAALPFSRPLCILVASVLSLFRRILRRLARRQTANAAILRRKNSLGIGRALR